MMMTSVPGADHWCQSQTTPGTTDSLRRTEKLSGSITEFEGTYQQTTNKAINVVSRTKLITEVHTYFGRGR